MIRTDKSERINSSEDTRWPLIFYPSLDLATGNNNNLIIQFSIIWDWLHRRYSIWTPLAVMKEPRSLKSTGTRREIYQRDFSFIFVWFCLSVKRRYLSHRCDQFSIPNLQAICAWVLQTLPLYCRNSPYNTHTRQVRSHYTVVLI